MLNVAKMLENRRFCQNQHPFLEVGTNMKGEVKKERYVYKLGKTRIKFPRIKLLKTTD